VHGQKKVPVSVLFHVVQMQTKQKQNVIKTPFHFKAVPSFVAYHLTDKLIEDV